MISTVAVGTDGSDTASKAVETAADMARRYEREARSDQRLQRLDRRAAPANLSGSSLEIQWATSPVARLTEQLERAQADAARQRRSTAAP